MKPAAALFLSACLAGLPAFAGPLLDSARAGNGVRVLDLLESGADVHQAGPHADTALHWMAFHGDADAVGRLLDRGADVNARNDTGNTPLHLAAYMGHTRVASVLLARGAAVDARTTAGLTPLDWAQRNGHVQVAELLRTGRAQAGSAADAHGAGDELRFEDLRHSTELRRTLAAYRQETRPSAGDDTRASAGIPAAAGSSSRGSTYRVQLAALGTPERAEEAARKYRRRYAEILGANALFVVPGRVNGRDVHKVQAGLASRQDARETCRRLQQAGQPCWVVPSGP